MIKIIKQAIFAFCLLQPISAKASADYAKTGFVFSKDRKPTILVIYPMIIMNKQGKTGLDEPHLEWTQMAQTNLRNALSTAPVSKSVTFHFMNEAEANASPVYADLVSAYYRRTSEIILKIPQNSDPKTAKRCKCSYTMGKDFGQRLLAAHGIADYVLIISQIDTYASAGQIFGEIAGAAVGGVMTPQGSSSTMRRMRIHGGNAMLFNITDGDILWFHGDGAFGGDLRKPESAKVRVNQVMSRFPVSAK